jgi:hypothetical protein
LLSSKKIRGGKLKENGLIKKYRLMFVFSFALNILFSVDGQIMIFSNEKMLFLKQIFEYVKPHKC